jgi:calcium-dependent protein kinase
MKRVKEGKFSFTDPVWNKVSDQGKDFIAQLLTKDQNKRPSADQALQHPWIQQANQIAKENVSSDAAMNALMNLQNFNAKSKLK